MRWAGFRKVRGQVRKRLVRRMKELSLSTVSEYKAYLESHAEEWKLLDSLCQITISRFYRDRGIFNALRRDVLPRLGRDAVARDESKVCCWSAGCGSGEEPYTLQIIWTDDVRPALSTDIVLQVMATVTDNRLLDRARAGTYPASSLKDMPQDLKESAFDRVGGDFVIRDIYRSDVTFSNEDVRETVPVGEFDLILCRNLAFTYYEESLQEEILEAITGSLRPGGFVVIGAHESLPATGTDLVQHETTGIYRKGRLTSG
jgi:chemotaxis protein methyltransferase CheR